MKSFEGFGFEDIRCTGIKYARLNQIGKVRRRKKEIRNEEKKGKF